MNTVTVVKPIIHLFPSGPCSPGVFFHNPNKLERPMSQIEKLLSDLINPIRVFDIRKQVK